VGEETVELTSEPYPVYISFVLVEWKWYAMRMDEMGDFEGVVYLSNGWRKTCALLACYSGIQEVDLFTMFNIHSISLIFPSDFPSFYMMFSDKY